MKILVTGAGGYVGGRLIEALLARGHSDIRAVSSRPFDKWLKYFPEIDNHRYDLRTREACEYAVAGAGWIFNLAAQVGGIGYVKDHKVDCMLSSLINTHLLWAAKKEGVGRYFFASSSCVYPPECSFTGHKETDAMPAYPTDGYGWEKLFSERMCLAFAEEESVPVRIARYHGIYGPHDIRPEGRDHVITALCKKVAKAKLSGNHEINIWGSGEQTRNFIYIDDIVEGTIRLMESDVVGPVNLAHREIVSVNELVTHLEEIAGVKLQRFYNQSAPVGSQHKSSNNTLLRESLNWEPSVSIKTGLRRTFNACWDEVLKTPSTTS